MKYIDLEPKITADLPPMVGADMSVLSWLDEHPDEIPGGTATEKEFEQAIAEIRELSLKDSYRELLSRFGITVVDDPEQTDEDRMISDLGALADGGLYLRDWHKGKIAQKLTELGWTKEGDES